MKKLVFPVAQSQKLVAWSPGAPGAQPFFDHKS